jgi:HEPN domain-containing protein
MKDETYAWLSYAAENLDVAELSLAHDHLNACLHNAQQAVEKYLKALFIEYGLPFKKTHAIYVLWQGLTDRGFEAVLTEEDCDLLDAVYMPSRYPLFSVLPDAMPDRETCEKCVRIACRVEENVRLALQNP